MPDGKRESQRERFEQAARELGVEMDEEKLKRALKAIARSSPVAEPPQPREDKKG